jgi:hypothetical protein
MSKDKNEYQKEYRKHKVHRVVIFSQEQYQLLKKLSLQQQKPFTTMVRELALQQATNQFVLPLDEQTNEVKILLIRYGTNLNQISHVCNSTHKVTTEIIEEVQTNFLEMKKGIVKIYDEPIQVKELVRRTLIKKPEYAKEIKFILTELQL